MALNVALKMLKVILFYKKLFKNLQDPYKTNNQRIRDIDINAPEIVGKIDNNIRRLDSLSIKTDSSKHKNDKINLGIYA